jgi:flagellar biosynthesis GTPase FlhF
MPHNMNSMAAKYFSQGRQLPVSETQSLGQKLYRSSFNKGHFQGEEAYVSFKMLGEEVKGKIITKNTDGSIVFSYLSKNGTPMKVNIRDNGIIESGIRLTNPDDIRFVRKRIDEDVNIDRMTASEYQEVRKKAASNAGQRATRETGEQARSAEDSGSTRAQSKDTDDAKNSEEHIKRQRQKQREEQERKRKQAEERARRYAEEKQRQEREAKEKEAADQAAPGSSSKLNYVSGKWAGSRVSSNKMHEVVFKKAGGTYHQSYQRIIELHNQGQRPKTNPEMKRLYKKLYQVIHPDTFRAKYPNQGENTYKTIEEIFKDIEALRRQP